MSSAKTRPSPEGRDLGDEMQKFVFLLSRKGLDTDLIFKLVVGFGSGWRARTTAALKRLESGLDELLGVRGPVGSESRQKHRSLSYENRLKRRAAARQIVGNGQLVEAAEADGEAVTVSLTVEAAKADGEAVTFLSTVAAEADGDAVVVSSTLEAAKSVGKSGDSGHLATAKVANVVSSVAAEGAEEIFEEEKRVVEDVVVLEAEEARGARSPLSDEECSALVLKAVVSTLSRMKAAAECDRSRMILGWEYQRHAASVCTLNDDSAAELSVKEMKLSFHQLLSEVRLSASHADIKDFKRVTDGFRKVEWQHFLSALDIQIMQLDPCVVSRTSTVCPFRTGRR